MEAKILVVEDDADINRLLSTLLRQKGYQTTAAFSGSEAKLLLAAEDYDLVLLDLMLPGIPGDTLLQDIRSRSVVPVIVISALADTQEKIATLQDGADDYITKPFEKAEVLARVEAQLRRYKQFASRSESDKPLIYRNLTVNQASRTARVEDQPLTLTAKEFDLLAVLARSPGKVFTREDLYQAVWKESYVVEDNAINVHMSNLRTKLAKAAKAAPDHPTIETVWGIGFKMA